MDGLMIAAPLEQARDPESVKEIHALFTHDDSPLFPPPSTFPSSTQLSNTYRRTGARARLAPRPILT
jgi:hypothetical protein